MSILDPRVGASWVGLNTPLEGCVPHLYLDTRGLVTVAIGALVDSPSAAAALTGWDAPADVVGDWHRVKAMPSGLLWTRYAAPGCPRLSPEGIEAVTLARLELDAEVLARRWPSLPGWPAAAQAATLALAWAVGAGATGSGLTGPTWPHLAAALDSEAWADAAVAGQLRWQGNAGVRPRDWVVAALYLEAAGRERGEAGWPAGVSRDAALRSLVAWDAAVESRATLPSGAPDVSG